MCLGDISQILAEDAEVATNLASCQQGLIMGARPMYQLSDQMHTEMDFLELKQTMADHAAAKSKAQAHLSKDDMPCNKPKGTPSHGSKSHVVKACDNGTEKIIRFGEKGARLLEPLKKVKVKQ